MNRHELLSEIGPEGQVILSQKRVAIVGCGALGTIASELLARAKIGTLLLIDRDVVEESNLQRQILYTSHDLGKLKVIAAKERLHQINPSINVEIHSIHISARNIELLQHCDLILDCTDNLQTRFMINDFAKKMKLPWIYAAAIKTQGYVMPILPDGPCLRCILQPAQLETCDTVGVLNTITTTIASLQVSIAYQILLEKLTNPSLTHFDIWKGTFEQLRVKQNPACLTCQGDYQHLKITEDEKVILFCSSQKFQILGIAANLQQTKKRWEKISTVLDDGFSLHFKNILLFADGRALISANSQLEAQALYSKYIGN